MGGLPLNLWVRVFAAGYDLLMARAERAGLARMREELLASAAGRVLEIGGGTGANLPFFGPAVAELVTTEPEEPMAARLERKAAGGRLLVKVMRAPAERLPFEDASFDCAVSTLVLCTVADPDAALAELRRVLRPGGRLLVIEHVRSSDPREAWWQDRLRLPWSWLGCGCQLNRRTREAVERAGFTTAGLRDGELPKAPFLVRPLILGEAIKT